MKWGFLAEKFYIFKCADQLQVPRIGRRHQAGSDALLTAQLFFKIKQLFFAENWDEVNFILFSILIFLGL